MSNYSASVVRIDNIREHENADRLACTNIYGNNVIVGKDTQIGDIGLFFPLESQIGEEFAKANDLLRRKDEQGKPAGGMFDQNRRVRAQTLRGEKSMGFFIPIESLGKLEGVTDQDLTYIEIGDEIDMYCGHEISKKYVVPTKSQRTGSKQGKSKKESRIIPEQFRQHFDTEQLGRNIDKIKPEDLISITWKLHGTSGIVGNVLCKKKLNFIEKVLKFLGVNIVDTEYDYIYSSRRVIKNEEKDYNHFYDSDVWTLAGEKFKSHLHKGEQVYYELVGYTPNGSEIQKGYDYKCKKNEFEIYIYRITQTNVDGVVTELPWHQVKHRAKELGFSSVPEIYYGVAADIADVQVDFMEEDDWSHDFFKYLGKYYVYDQDSQFCNSKVPEEGVVVRIEHGDGIVNYKLKSFRFLQHESKMLDKGEFDMETEQSGEEQK